MKNATDHTSLNDIDNPYQLYVDFTVKTMLNDAEFAMYERINNDYASCFSTAKQNKPELAAQHLEQGNLLKEKASSNVKTLVSVFCMPYISYYYYKIKDYELAAEYSQTIIDQAFALEKTDHEYLFFCRIQQEQNLGRIYWTNNEIRKSIEKYAECMLEIYAKSQSWNTEQVINNLPVKILAENTQYHFFLQVITEILNRIILKHFKEPSLAISYLQIFFNPLTKLDFEHLSTHNPAYQSFKDCITTFSLLIAGDAEQFTHAASNFLDNPLYDQEMKKVICRYLYYFDYISA